MWMFYKGLKHINFFFTMASLFVSLLKTNEQEALRRPRLRSIHRHDGNEYMGWALHGNYRHAACRTVKAKAGSQRSMSGTRLRSATRNCASLTKNMKKLLSWLSKESESRLKKKTSGLSALHFYTYIYIRI